MQTFPQKIDPGVRDAATDALSVVYKAAGEKFLAQYTVDLEAVKLTKVSVADVS